MKFNIFKHKKDNSKTFEGRFVDDDEISKMIKPKNKSFIKSEFDIINEMFDKLKNINGYD